MAISRINRILRLEQSLFEPLDSAGAISAEPRSLFLCLDFFGCCR
jgi:hypothetical protein